MLRFPLLLWVLVLASSSAVAQKKPVTLETLRQARPPEMAGAPVWAPDGKRFAFRQGSKLFLYDVLGKSQKELLSLDDVSKLADKPAAAREMDWENRRVRESPVQWSRDGKALLILSQGDVFFWTPEAGVTQLTKTPVPERDPKLSPDGKKISFRREHDLYVMTIADKKVVRLTTDGSDTLLNGELDWVYPEELDLGTGYWWSPDSNSIAYLQFDVSREQMYPQADHLKIEAVAEPERYPKAGSPNADVRVGVVPVAGGSTKWLNYGETRDHLTARVHWSPNSRDVVVHRMNRVQNRLEILSADIESNQTRTLIKETDPTWINLTDDFQFLSNGEILRTSEKDGFRHLYLHDKDGKQKTQLTKGDWEVSDVACVDEKAKKIYYSSTEVSPLERHLYVIGFDGKGKRHLTKGPGSHSISMSPACDYYVDNYSNQNQPWRRTIHTSDGEEWVVYKEADRKDVDEYDLLKTEFLNFQGEDGTKFYARLIKPANFDPTKKYPAIVMVYGGPHAQSVRNSFSGPSWDQVLAHKGFVIWQMDNRGSAGRGHAFESKLYRRLGKQELEDQKSGVKHLLSLGFVDDKRIGVYGWSYGGFMTIYSLLHAPETFAAGVAGAAVTDWRNYDTIYTERYLGLPQENEEGYKLSSPVHAAANLKGKLLILHNAEDDNVLFANALQMTNALQEANKPFQFQLYPQKSHGVSGKHRHHMMETATQFFVDALRP